jgi:hypothetical protein
VDTTKNENICGYQHSSASHFYRRKTMKKGGLFLLSLVVILVAVFATGRVLANTETEAEWLAEIGELHGGIAFFTRNDPDCRWLAAEGVFVCPEPYPTVWPTPDPADRQRALAQLGTTGLLLVPDSTNRRIMAFDPLTGQVLDSNFVPPDPANLDLPLNAILSPAGDSILVSSYNDDLIQEYDFLGNYLGFYAPAGGPDPTILDTPRGIDQRDTGNLLVANSRNPNIDDVAEFDNNGNPLGAFIANGAGGLDSPYDLHRWMDTWLVGGATSDALHRYDLNGAFLANFAAVDGFPQQIQAAANGNVLVANFSGTQKGVLEFDPAGNVVSNFNPQDDGQRGIYELPNGNLLTASGTTNGAVYELDRTTGTVVDIKFSDNITPRYIELVQSPFSIVLTKTVGLDPAQCAGDDTLIVPTGSTVTYCYTVQNTGTMTLTDHDLDDDVLGPILENFPYTLAPGATVFVTHTATVTETTVNTAIWTARNGTGRALATDSATVETRPIGIDLAKTVGTDPAGCATTSVITVTTGTSVTYCYSVTNTGAFTLTRHDLDDSALGTLLDDFQFTLAPNTSTFVTRTATLTETITNSALWTAYTTPGPGAVASAQATVNVTPMQSEWLLYLPVMLQPE